MKTFPLFSAMKHLPMLSVLALLGAAIPAQKFSIEGRIGRGIHASVVVGKPCHDRGHRERVCVEPVRRIPAPPRGHWQTVYEEVLVPGYWHEEHVPATWGWIYDSCGHRRWGVVAPASCRRVWVPARYEMRSRQVWVAC